jgi:leader peptidase (prepilin peptidase)/N-methyltransferase
VTVACCIPGSGIGVLAVAPPRWAVVAAAALAGLAIGSFLNVVVYRVPRHLSVVRPPSFCPSCRTPVRPADNVPVLSWLVLGGRCRACGEPISMRYPLVETTTGLLFALVALAVGSHWAVAGLCVAAATVFASTAVELDGLRPPPAVALVGSALTIALLVGAATADHGWGRLGGAGGGTLLALLVAVAASRWSPRTEEARLRGMGWPLVPAGIVLGWCGPVGASAGIGTLGVLLMVLPAARRPRPEAQPGGVRAAGVASAAALACVVAVIVALGVGTSLWH